MFARGGAVRRMQAGGDPMMAPPMQDEMAMAPPPAGMPAPQEMPMDQAAQAAMQKGIDPSVLESLLQDAAGSFATLDAAENAGDYEQMINAIRGDQMPLQERRMELADLVGEADAAQTPDSVLTLVQPIMQIAAVDQGIGSMAPEVMETPVEGDMAGGIMSMVNMAEPAPSAEGSAPVNFERGGAVQYMQQGGVAMPNARQQTLFEEQQALYNQLIDPSKQTKELEEQRNLTQAQMLFDIAQGGLALASPPTSFASPAARFAEAFTPVVGSIGARAGEFGKFKQAQQAEQRQMDLAAMQSAQSLFSAERQAELAQEGKPIKDVFNVAVTEMSEDGKPVTRSLGQMPLTQKMFDDLKKKFGEGNISISPVATASTTIKSAENFMLPDGSTVSAIPGTSRYNQLVSQNALRMAGLSPDMVEKREQVTLTTDIIINNRTYRAGSSPNFTAVELGRIADTYGSDAYTEYTKPVSDQDYFNRYGMPKDAFEALPQEDQQFLQGLPVLTDKDYFNRFGFTKNDFEALPTEDRQILLGLEPKYRFEKMQGEDGSVTVVRINERTGETLDVLDRQVNVAPSYFQVTLPGEDGRQQQLVVDIKTPEGKEVVAKVNEQNAREKGSASFLGIPTADIKPRGFYVPGTEDYEGGVYTSYDGGKTFVDKNGVQQKIPSNGFEVSNTIAYDVNRNARITEGARRQLDEIDANLVKGMTGPDGKPLPAETKQKARDALRQARLGTGFWSKMYAGIDGVLGGVIAPEYFSDIFRDEQDARQFVEMIRVFGRSALSSSPRFAVADLEQVQRLFPDETALFRNPETEARKLSRLAEELQLEKRRILGLRASGEPIDSQLDSTLSQKLFEIERLEQLLGPVISMSNMASQADLERAQQVMQGAAARGLQGGS